MLETARKQLLLDFDSSKGFAHSGIKGEERSESLGSFLKTRLPPTFGIGTGEVIDSRDHRTGQIDLFIYDKTVTQPVHAGWRNQLYPCEAVYAVIEVKSVFNRTEAEICFSTAQRIRKLKPFKQSFADARTMGAPAEKEGHRCMYVIFAYSTDIREQDWLKREYHRLSLVSSEKNVPTTYIDRLLVLDRGMINTADAQGKTVDGDPASLFAEFFLHLVNFLDRERKRRPQLSWQTYALPRSQGWQSLRTKEAR